MRIVQTASMLHTASDAYRMYTWYACSSRDKPDICWEHSGDAAPSGPHRRLFVTSWLTCISPLQRSKEERLGMGAQGCTVRVVLAAWPHL